MTVADLIRASMRKLGVLAAGEELPADVSQDALEALNAMLETWSIERLYVYSIVAKVYALQAGKATYTIGPGGDFDQERPNNIQQAFVRYTLNGPQAPDIPIQLLTTEEWAAEPVKNTTSTFPTKMYNDSDNPLSNLTFWPVPTLNVPVVLWCWGALTAFGDISDDVVLPPGYYRALVYNLAVELAPEFGRSVTTEIAASATEAKGAIKIINSPELKMVCDEALTGAYRGGWNYLTGEYQRNG